LAPESWSVPAPSLVRCWRRRPRRLPLTVERGAGIDADAGGGVEGNRALPGVVAGDIAQRAIAAVTGVVELEWYGGKRRTRAAEGERANAGGIAGDRDRRGAASAPAFSSCSMPLVIVVAPVKVLALLPASTVVPVPDLTKSPARKSRRKRRRTHAFRRQSIAAIIDRSADREGVARVEIVDDFQIFVHLEGKTERVIGVAGGVVGEGDVVMPPVVASLSKMILRDSLVVRV